LSRNGAEAFQRQSGVQLREQENHQNEIIDPTIPVHPKLVELGFLAWVEARKKVSTNGRIFVDYRYGNWFNQVFSVAVGVKTDRLVFHSFRHNMADALRNATESDETRDRLWAIGARPRASFTALAISQSRNPM
jgi:hypothetical protein